jgi:hypothetical protein
MERVVMRGFSTTPLVTGSRNRFPWNVIGVGTLTPFRQETLGGRLLVNARSRMGWG